MLPIHPPEWQIEDPVEHHLSGVGSNDQEVDVKGGMAPPPPP